MALRVNGETIESAEIQEEFRRLLPSYTQYVNSEMTREERDRQLTEWSKENVIERVLLRQSAMKIPFDSQAFEQAWSDVQQHRGPKAVDEQMRARFEEHFRLSILMEEIGRSAPEPTEEEVRAHYEANADLYAKPEMVHAAHIVKHLDEADEFGVVRRQMEELAERLHGGESWEAVSLRHNDCPTNSGDLGFFARGQMVERFEDVVFAMEPGQTSGVFETEFGYHIARVIDKTPAAPMAFEDVCAEIRQTLWNQRKQVALENYVDDLKARAEIVED